MHLSVVSTLLLSPFCLTAAVHLADLLRFTSSSTTISSATPGSVLLQDASVPMQQGAAPKLQRLELRQVPPDAAPAVPVNTVVPNTALVNPVAPILAPANPIVPVNPIPPAAAKTTAQVSTKPLELDTKSSGALVSETVQWVETWIGGTSRTWVPRTITFHFPAFVTQASEPGHGAVGMGTLTGRLGVTKTVVVGSAATKEGDWIVAAIGFGVGVGVVGVL